MNWSVKPSFSIKVNWKIGLFSLLLMPLLISLGFWQLRRAEEKQTIQDLWRHQQAMPPIEIDAILDSDDNFRRVKVTGQFIPERYWLLENKIRDGRLGYEIVMPFRLVDGHWLIVNRGWAAAGRYREDMPHFSTPNAQITLSGTLSKPSNSVFIDETQSTVQHWPHRVLEIDPIVMKQQLGRPLMAKVLRLGAGSPAALEVGWQPVNMTPAKHIGYALQWFAMAVALGVLFIFANSNLAEILKYYCGKTLKQDE